MCVNLSPAAHDLALELVDQTLGISKAELPFEDDFLVLLLDGWRQAVKRGTDAAIEFLETVGDLLSDAEVGDLLATLRANTGAVLVGDQIDELGELFQKSYEKGKVAGFGSPEISFGLLDEMSVSWLKDHHLWWIQNYYDRFLSASIAETVRAGVQEGLGRAAIGGDLREFFSDYPGIPHKPDTYWRGLAANAMNRSRNFGKVGGFVDAGFSYVEVVAVMDERTSPICQEMNGRQISVADCNAQRLKIMQSTSPTDIKEIAPWPAVSEIEGLTTEQIVQEAGIAVPPYHFHCRTTLVGRK